MYTPDDRALRTCLLQTYVDGYMTCALPCLNAKHFAAKTYGKGQHALITFYRRSTFSIRPSMINSYAGVSLSLRQTQ